MSRKRWTANSDNSDEIIKAREKRKWQIALRRYIVDGNPSTYYAPFFGLDIRKMREWVQLQVPEEIDWKDFSAKWQLDHVLPVSYFDFNSEEEMRLCWNFVNIAVIGVGEIERIDIVAVKRHFQDLYNLTRYEKCKELVMHIEKMEQGGKDNTGRLQSFINNNKELIDTISRFEAYSFRKLNEGENIDSIVAEIKLIASLKG